MRNKSIYSLFYICLFCVIVQSCSSTKFVPDGEYLLSKTEIKVDTKDVTSMEMENYIKQKPNYKTFMLFKLPLSIYNLSGRDSTKWINKTLRRAGEPPVIYDSTLLDQSENNIKRIMNNKGYLNAKVSSTVKFDSKKANVIYDIHSNGAYRINNYKINVPPSVIDTIFFTKQMIDRIKQYRRFRNIQSPNTNDVLLRNTLVTKGSKFDLDVLDEERSRITSIFRRIGYYAFDKEDIGFVVDTTLGANNVDVELNIYPFAQRTQDGQVDKSTHQRYTVKEVKIYVDYNHLVNENLAGYNASSVYNSGGYKIFYGERGQYIRPNVVLANCHIQPGEVYDEDKTSQTYNSFSRLSILKNISISYSVIANDSTQLVCTITCLPDKKQGISAEIEGTNTGGFFGLEGALGYSHRNIFKGSETFSVKMRGAYEAITPSFQNFNDNYFEIGGETSLTVPRFIFPFIKNDFKKQVFASTQLNANYTFQRRPGYFKRTVLSGGVKYLWHDRRNSSNRHIVDLLDISYVHIPDLSSNFENSLTINARKYSFTDQFIVGGGYTYTKKSTQGSRPIYGVPISSMRISVETAGNLLALIAKLSKAESDSMGIKKLFGTRYVQYARGTFDFSQAINLDERNSFAWHIGGGLAYPYGNYKEIPIQKRFFAGGANSVRGWGVRELGPGSFHPSEGKYDNFFYHSGDIRLDANLEYRSKVFWILELAAFVDAGNIWTVKRYEGQEGGEFKFKEFYKDIALAWGLGLRFDFDFVLLRLDCGWKAYDPANTPNGHKWKINRPFDISHNTAWHIAVGYPF